MSNSKFVMIELIPEDLMQVVETMSEMLVALKRNPELLRFVPNDPMKIMVTIMHQVIERREREEKKEGVDPEEEKELEKKLEQSVNAAMEAMAKAAGKL